MIVDSHAHLDMTDFGPDRDEVLRRALDAELSGILCIGTGNPSSSSVEDTLVLAETHDWIHAGIGVHPHDAQLADEDLWKRLERCAAHPKVVVWGEIGLDYYYDHSPREIQKDVFRRQLGMARNRGLPISIHCRDAWEDLARILDEEWEYPRTGGILHSFTGSLDSARYFAERGFLISFSGIVTFKNAGSLREVARALSPDQVLVETDSPYLAPVPHRGKRNEPAFVVDVARSLAEVMGIAFEDLARRTTENYKQLLELS